MAINVTNFTSTLRKQGLLALLQNMNINFLEIKNKLFSYCNTDGDTYSTLIDLFNVDTLKMSSSEINASVLLFYLDFYTNYISLHSLYESYKGLVEVSKSKYIYIDSIIKDLSFQIESKEQIKVNKYVDSIDFTNTGQVTIYKSDIASRTGSMLSTLNTEPILSLPINSSKELAPYNILSLSKNSTESFKDITEKYTNDIYSNLIRLDNDYVCVVNNIVDSNKNISKSLSINVSGLIADIDLSSVYIKVADITDNGVYVCCSSTSEEWSSNIKIESGTKYRLYLEEDIETGLYFSIIFDTTIKENDTWVVNLKRLQLPYPSTTFKIMFNNFEDFSLIKFNDISNYKLELNSIYAKRRKTTNQGIDYNLNNNRLIAFPNESIKSLDIDFTQKDSDVYNYNGNIGYNYTFYLSDIKAIINEYIPHGNKSFNKINIEEINNIQILSNEYIYKPTEDYITKMFIEYNLYIEMDLDKLLIPVLTTTAVSGVGINEYLIPSSINESNTALYKTRFPVDTTSSIYLINLTDNTSEIIYIEGTNQELSYSLTEYSYVNINIRNFDSSKQFAIKYMPLIYNSEDTYDLTVMDKWIKEDKLYFMYFRDMGNNIRIAVKIADDNNYILPLTGTISSFIEMRSIEESHLSPYILKYSVLCN